MGSFLPALSVLILAFGSSWAAERSEFRLHPETSARVEEIATQYATLNSSEDILSGLKELAVQSGISEPDRQALDLISDSLVVDPQAAVEALREKGLGERTVLSLSPLLERIQEKAADNPSFARAVSDFVHARTLEIAQKTAEELSGPKNENELSPVAAVAASPTMAPSIRPPAIAALTRTPGSPFIFEGDPEDVAKVRRVFESLYPGLMPETKDILAKGVIFQLSRSDLAVKKGAGGVWGWGPEDDPDYRFPDTQLYPRGSIKVTFTPALIEWIDFAERAQHPRLKRFLMTTLGSTLTHELKHVDQFMTKPVRAFDRNDLCGEHGECDEDRLRDTMTKMLDYEREAFETDFAYENTREDDRAWVRSHLERHPELLEGTSDAFRRNLQKTLIERSGPMKRYQIVYYNSAFRPVFMVRRYQELLDRLRASSGDTIDIHRELAALNEEHAEQQAFFEKYRMDPSHARPHLALVWPRLRAYFEEAQRLLGASPAQSVDSEPSGKVLDVAALPRISYTTADGRSIDLAEDLDLLFAELSLSEGERRLLQDATLVAFRAHRDDFRKFSSSSSPMPYLRHIVGTVKTLLIEYGVRDPRSLAIALLHDVKEDHRSDWERELHRFDPVVRNGVDLLTKEEDFDAYARRLTENGSRDVLLIKLADRTNNLRSIRRSLNERLPKDLREELLRFAEKKFKETDEHILPLAQRAVALRNADKRAFYRTVLEEIHEIRRVNPEISFLNEFQKKLLRLSE